MIMKKKILLLMGIFSLGILRAQVGINTQSPIGIFHIDPKGDTNISGSVGAGDDVIIDKLGNIGAGALPRSDVKVNLTDGGTSANVKSVFQLQDGNEGIGKVLISDASGNATWKEYIDFGLTIGKFGAGVYFCVDAGVTNATYGIVPRSNNNGVKTTGEITLGKGLWWVRCSMYIAAAASVDASKQVWVRTTLADDSSFSTSVTMSNQMTKDLLSNHSLASSLIWCSGSGGVVQGSFIVDNRSMAGTSKKYYLLVGWIDDFNTPAAAAVTIFRSGLASSGENSLFAYRIEE